MGCPLGPSLANVFLCHHETKWLNNCPKNFKLVFYKRYVDDIFILFKKPEHVKPFADYMNSKLKRLNFILKQKNQANALTLCQRVP